MNPADPSPQSEPRPHDALVEPLFAGLSGAGESSSEASGAASPGAAPLEGSGPTGEEETHGAGVASSEAESWEFPEVDLGEAARESRPARLLGFVLGALLVGHLLRLMLGSL